MADFTYRKAELRDIEYLGNRNIEKHPDDCRWVRWTEEGMENHRTGRTAVFTVLCDKVPVGEGTLVFSPECSAISGRTELADNCCRANINALRIQKEYEGQGHISGLVRMMEAYAREQGYTYLTIGVEAKETRNLAIYLHWGYTKFVTSETEDGELVLYYEKNINSSTVN